MKPRGYYLELFWQADLGYIGQAIIGVKVPNSSHVASIQHRRVSNRVFQNFWGNGNQRFLSTTFAPGCRETLRFAKKLRFLLSPGL